jgi:hypothetical protein
VGGALLRVDELVLPSGYAYASNPTTTDATGRFGLLVFRINQFELLSAPDTTRVLLKLYASEAAAEPGATANDSVLVLMTFAPMGTSVDTTDVEMTLR